MPAVSPGTDNLVAWWSLDETSGTRADSHDSNDLTDNNTVGYAAGKVGNAADFVEVNSEYLSVSLTMPSPVTAMSYVGWWNTDSLSGQVSVFNYIGTAGMLVNRNASSIRVWIGGGGNYTLNPSPSPNFSTGTWYHVAVVYDGSGATNDDRGKIYIDGAVLTSPNWLGTIPASISGGSQSVVVGKGSGYFDGLLDETCVFNDALTADEVAWLYNSGTGRAYSELGGAASYEMMQAHHRLLIGA